MLLSSMFFLFFFCCFFFLVVLFCFCFLFFVVCFFLFFFFFCPWCLCFCFAFYFKMHSNCINSDQYHFFMYILILFESKINKLITKKNSLCKIQFQNLLDQHLLLMRKSAICCKVNFTGRRPALRIFTETMVSILTSGALFSCWVNVPQISLPSLVPQRKIYIVLSQVSMATILYTTIYVYSLSNEKINGNSWKTNLQKQKNTFFFLLWS